ncbi:MAG TPA: CPBP family intramembrane glutamic endopeptidase [Candidatus Acidoferrum sp.]|nr:CPBP family intramembrane glutamic endopeptidase [Candidatus Acidoferrum sp.]
MFNRQGPRAGWRIILYLSQVLLLWEAGNAVLDRVLPAPERDAPSFPQMFVTEALRFAAVFLPALVMARLESRASGDYGLPAGSRFGARFWHGVLLGIVQISVLIGSIALFGGYRLGPLALDGVTMLRWALLWALFFALVGLFEEFAFRGYLQFTLADGIGFWPAASLLSFGFGCVHLLNRGESKVGALSVVAIALVFALALKRTGNLWLAVGWHAAFDFGETFLYSVPNSGIVYEHHLTDAVLHGPVWLTGGTVGPEGSAFSFLTMAAAALYVHKVFPSGKTAGTDQENSAAASPAS